MSCFLHHRFNSYNSKITGTYLIFAFSFITTTQFMTFLVAFVTLANTSTLSLGTLTFAFTLDPVDWSVHGSNLHAECYIENIRQKFECEMSDLWHVMAYVRTTGNWQMLPILSPRRLRWIQVSHSMVTVPTFSKLTWSLSPSSTLLKNPMLPVPK